MTKKILYNITVKITNEKSVEWLQWMKEVHIPEVMMTRKFESYKLSKIIDEDDDGKTYAIQYISPSMDHFIEYQNHFAKKLQFDHSERYKNSYVAFRTLMEIITESN